MTEQDQIKALAELDGYSREEINEPILFKWANFNKTDTLVNKIQRHPDYLHSYDAIIPLIQKQKTSVIVDTILRPGTTIFDATPQQLCEALLRATGKWKE